MLINKLINQKNHLIQIQELKTIRLFYSSILLSVDPNDVKITKSSLSVDEELESRVNKLKNTNTNTAEGEEEIFKKTEEQCESLKSGKAELSKASENIGNPLSSGGISGFKEALPVESGVRNTSLMSFFSFYSKNSPTLSWFTLLSIPVIIYVLMNYVPVILIYISPELYSQVEYICSLIYP
jgi:hypothetical protein